MATDYEIMDDKIHLYYHLSHQDASLVPIIVITIRYSYNEDTLKDFVYILAKFMRGDNYIQEIMLIATEYQHDLVFKFYLISLIHDLLKKFPSISKHLTEFFYYSHRLFTRPNIISDWHYLIEHLDLAVALLDEYQPTERSIPRLLISPLSNEVEEIIHDYRYGVGSDVYLKAAQHWDSQREIHK